MGGKIASDGSLCTGAMAKAGVLAMGLAACASPAGTQGGASNKLNVVTTVSPVANIIYNIGGEDYLLQMTIPNTFFHIAMAYAILRHNGVDVGKMDFLGPINLVDA